MNSPGVTVKTATYRHEAELILLNLEAAGITAWLVDQFLVSADPLMSNAIGGIKINVAEADEASARRLLETLDREQPSGDACLSCGAPMPETVQACPACGWSFMTS